MTTRGGSIDGAASEDIACSHPPSTSLDSQETEGMTASLRRMDLIGRNEQPYFSLLTGGVSSVVVRAETARGTICVKRALGKLKVAADWFAPPQRNRAEVAWIRIAMRVAPGFAPTILGEDPEENTFAMEYFSPETHPVWKSRLQAGLATQATAAAVGRRLAAIHDATAGNTAVMEQFSNDTMFYQLRLEPYFAYTAERHPRCAAELRRLIDVTARTRLALVHGDVSPKNILAGPKGPVLLDAECAWYGDPAFDLAFCLTHLLLKCFLRPSASMLYSNCFDELWRNYQAGVAWEPTETLEGRAAALIPGLLLARVDGKSPVEYMRAETDRERVRRAASRMFEQSVNRVETVKSVWKAETGF